MNDSLLHDVENAFGKLTILLERSSDVLKFAPEDILIDIPKSASVRLTNGHAKVELISEIIGRRHLKVVFFGRTSSGKSSIINALLGKQVLPSGLGHTTSCFIEVRGTGRRRPFLVMSSPDGTELVEAEDVLSELTHLLRSESFGPDATVQLFWPRHMCSFLEDDVVLVDSPGIDVSADSDSWIDHTCLDADLLVWVVNGEATVTTKEKTFFQQIASKVAKPNILVTVNRWDCASEEEEYLIHAAHSQHLQRICDFLLSQLKICMSLNELEQKIFFVSAKEVLDHQCMKSAPSCILQSKLYEERKDDWQRLVTHINASLDDAFKGCRYLNHLDSGIEIAHDITRINSRIITLCADYCFTRDEMLEFKEQMLQKLEDGMEQLTKDLKMEIANLLNETEAEVKTSLTKELEAACQIVEDLHPKFCDDAILMSAYVDLLKREMEEALALRLGTRFAKTICARVTGAQTNILDRVSSILPREKRDFLDISPRRVPLELLDAIAAQEWLVDFHPNISFNFSLSPVNVFHRYLTFRRMVTEKRHLNAASDERTRWRRVTHHVFSASIAASEASAITLLVLGVAYRSISWRVFASAGVLFSVLFVWEKTMWNFSAKEKALKNQFVAFAKANLPRAENHLCCYCRGAAQRELVSTLVLACTAAEGAGLEVKSELEQARLLQRIVQSTGDKARDAVSSVNELVARLKAIKRYLC